MPFFTFGLFIINRQFALTHYPFKQIKQYRTTGFKQDTNII